MVVLTMNAPSTRIGLNSTCSYTVTSAVLAVVEGPFASNGFAWPYASPRYQPYSGVVAQLVRSAQQIALLLMVR